MNFIKQCSKFHPNSIQDIRNLPNHIKGVLLNRKNGRHSVSIRSKDSLSGLKSCCPNLHNWNLAAKHRIINNIVPKECGLQGDSFKSKITDQDFIPFLGNYLEKDLVARDAVRLFATGEPTTFVRNCILDKGIAKKNNFLNIDPVTTNISMHLSGRKEYEYDDSCPREAGEKRTPKQWCPGDKKKINPAYYVLGMIPLLIGAGLLYKYLTDEVEEDPCPPREKQPEQ